MGVHGPPAFGRRSWRHLYERQAKAIEPRARREGGAIGVERGIDRFKALPAGQGRGGGVLAAHGRARPVARKENDLAVELGAGHERPFERGGAMCELQNARDAARGDAEEPGALRAQAILELGLLGDHLPAIAGADLRVELGSGKRDAEHGLHIGAGGGRKQARAFDRPGRQMQDGQLFQKRLLPPSPAGCERAGTAHAARNAGRLGIDKSAGLAVKEVIALAGHGADSGTDRGRASRSRARACPQAPLGPFGAALALSGRVADRLGIPSELLNLGRPDLARDEPLGHPIRPRRGGECPGRVDMEEQQAQSMLTGKLSARARAFERRLGKSDLDLIGLGPTSLTGSPNDLGVTGERIPFACLGEILAALGGSGIGRQLQDELARQTRRHF